MPTRRVGSVLQHGCWQPFHARPRMSPRSSVHGRSSDGIFLRSGIASTVINLRKPLSRRSGPRARLPCGRERRGSTARQVGRSGIDRFGTSTSSIGQSLHAPDAADFNAWMPMRGKSSVNKPRLPRRSRSGSPSGVTSVVDIGGRSGISNARGAAAASPRRPASAVAGPLISHGRSREARSRRSADINHVRRRGAALSGAIWSAARFHQGMVFTERRRSRRAVRRCQGRRRRGPSGRGAPCRARDRAHRGQGLAQGRRGFSGALGRGTHR